MSKHMDFLRGALGDAAIRCSADGVGSAVALTADELVLTRASGAGGKLERFALNELERVRVLPNPHASMFEAHFAGGRSARLMYYRDAAADVERLQQLLGSIAGDSQGAVAAVPSQEPPGEAVPSPAATAFTEGDDLARSARMNRIILALIVIPLVIVYVYSTYSR